MLSYYVNTNINLNHIEMGIALALGGVSGIVFLTVKGSWTYGYSSMKKDEEDKLGYGVFSASGHLPQIFCITIIIFR